MTSNEKLQQLINHAVEIQREKLFKQWCKNSNQDEREALYAKSQALDVIKLGIIKTLREGEK